MPRRSTSGKYIFSASEVAEYVVCPEAWYHKRIKGRGAEEKQSAEVQAGDKLHREWAAEYAEGLSIARLLRLLVALVMTATVLMLLRGAQ